MKVLCIATHPDDETLGAGGTLLRHRDDGDEIHWLVATKAIAPNFSDADAKVQARQMDAVAKAFGFATVTQLAFPSATLDRVPDSDLVSALLPSIRAVAPDVVYVNHGGDVHSDHSKVFQCVCAALKPFRFGLASPTIYAMEVPSETDQAPAGFNRPFLPTTFVDVSGFIDRKIEIFALYESEQQAFPLPREESAIRALARWRGATIGVAAAEAFMLVREVR